MPTTQWTLIQRLQHGDEKRSRAALDELCRAYHYPLYCHIRRRGLDHHDAEDVLHDFLAKLLRHDSFGLANAEKGRLRSFLLTALQRFLLNWHRGENRRQQREVSDRTEELIASAGSRYEKEDCAHHESPDVLYDRQWAQEMMRLVIEGLRSRYDKKGKTPLFDALLPILLSGGSLTDNDSNGLAASLNMRPGTLRTALYRLLKEYREALQRQILETVETREMAKVEFAELMTVFQR